MYWPSVQHDPYGSSAVATVLAVTRPRPYSRPHVLSELKDVGSRLTSPRDWSLTSLAAMMVPSVSDLRQMLRVPASGDCSRAVSCVRGLLPGSRRPYDQPDCSR